MDNLRARRCLTNASMWASSKQSNVFAGKSISTSQVRSGKLPRVAPQNSRAPIAIDVLRTRDAHAGPCVSLRQSSNDRSRGEVRRALVTNSLQCLAPACKLHPYTPLVCWEGVHPRRKTAAHDRLGLF
jgi:hypothetical protein